MRERRDLRLGAIVLGAACLAACAAPPGGSPATAGASPGPASPSAPPPASLAVNGPREILDPLIEHAATRAGVDASGVRVVEARPQTWPNGALGCPSPGVLYTQAIVTGWQVVLEAGGARYDYRATGPGRFKLCTSDVPGPSSSASS